MRRILATSLLLPSLFLPAAVKASTPVDDASAPTPHVRISSGVTAPEILNAAQVKIPDGYDDFAVPGDGQVGIDLTVDENGRPQNVHVTKSLNPLWDARVVDAVSHAHFKPATVDNQPTPIDLNLTVNIAH